VTPAKTDFTVTGTFRSLETPVPAVGGCYADPPGKDGYESDDAAV
jgi:hypothetical protein